MAEDEPANQQAIAALAREITLLAAENLAMQFVLTCLLQRIGEAAPALRRPIIQAFDEAANHAENFSLRAGTDAAHLPETLRIIEKMRATLMGESKPTREV